MSEIPCVSLAQDADVSAVCATWGEIATLILLVALSQWVTCAGTSIQAKSR